MRTIEVFLKYINGKGLWKNNINPLEDKDGLLTNRDMDKAGVFNIFFSFVYGMDDGIGVSMAWAGELWLSKNY